MTVCQPSILVEYCDLMTSVFHHIPWIFILLYFQNIPACILKLDILRCMVNDDWIMHNSTINNPEHHRISNIRIQNVLTGSCHKREPKIANLEVIYCMLLTIGSLDVTCDKVLHQNIVSSKVLSCMTCDTVDEPQLFAIILLILEVFAIIEGIFHYFHNLFFWFLTSFGCLYSLSALCWAVWPMTTPWNRFRRPCDMWWEPMIKSLQ